MSENMIRLVGRVELQAAVGDKPKRLQIVAYNGDEMNVDGFGPLVIALDGIGLPATVPILADHEADLDSVIGSGSPKIDAGKLVVRASMADGPCAERVQALLAAGVPLQASVGAQPMQKRYAAQGESVQVNGKEFTAGERGLLVVEKSALREISIVAIGADGETSVSMSAKKGASNMSDTIVTNPVDPVQSALEKERKRIKKIEAIAAGLNLDGAAGAQFNQLRARAIAGEVQVKTLRSAALDLIRGSRPSFSVGTGSGGGWISEKDHLSCALLVRAGFAADAEKMYGETVMEQSKPLHHAHMMDICKASLAMKNIPIPASKDDLIKAVFSSTGDMPVGLGDFINKLLFIQYKAAPASWRSFASVKTANDFHTQHGIRPTFAGDMQLLPKSGEIIHGTFSEDAYTWSVDTYAKMYEIDRRDFINDNIGLFGDLAQGLARAAARALNKLVVTTMLSGASAFWKSGNANYFSGSTTNLQSSSLTTAIQKLRQMKDSEGNNIDLQPACLLVPPELEGTAKELIQSQWMQRYVASGTDRAMMGNALQNACAIAVEPRLSDSAYTGYSTTAWWLFSDQVNASVIVGFLDGREAPITEIMPPTPNQLGISIRGYQDFGCALADYRASIQSKGAA